MIFIMWRHHGNVLNQRPVRPQEWNLVLEKIRSILERFHECIIYLSSSNFYTIIVLDGYTLSMEISTCRRTDVASENVMVVPVYSWNEYTETVIDSIKLLICYWAKILIFLSVEIVAVFVVVIIVFKKFGEMGIVGVKIGYFPIAVPVVNSNLI